MIETILGLGMIGTSGYGTLKLLQKMIKGGKKEPVQDTTFVDIKSWEIRGAFENVKTPVHFCSKCGAPNFVIWENANFQEHLKIVDGKEVTFSQLKPSFQKTAKKILNGVIKNKDLNAGTKKYLKNILVSNS